LQEGLATPGNRVAAKCRARGSKDLLFEDAGRPLESFDVFWATVAGESGGF
jgi:hypothetical protein